MEIFIYLKITVLLAILAISGFAIARRVFDDNRAQILLPASIITGIAVYIFLLNLTAYLFKGPPGFYIALAVEILLAYIIKKKIKAKEIIFPEGKEKVFWLTSLGLWTILLLYVSATGHATSGDFFNHTTLATLFSRGDFPIHAPFQPERLSSYHVGGPELLGSFKSITQAQYSFLFTIFSTITLLAIAQIFQWIIKVPQKIFYWVLLLLIPITALISFGNFMLVWPYQLGLPDLGQGLFAWIAKLPTLKSAFNEYGSPTNLDSFNLFFHRMLSVSFLAAMLPFLFAKGKKFLTALVFLIFLAALALTDETVFIVAAPATIIISFFTIFEKKLKHFLLFCVIAAVLTVVQGGLVNEVIFKSDTTIAKALIMPQDQEGSLAKFHNYRSFRQNQQAPKLIPQEAGFNPFKWFHPGIIWQLCFLILTLILALTKFKKKFPENGPIQLIILFTISAVFSLIAYHVIVPAGWLHPNGNRFLSLAYQLSGTALIMLIVLGWIYIRAQNENFKKAGKILKILLVWVLAVSIIPSFASIFPRQDYNWLKFPKEEERKELVWIEKNLKVNDRILPFMQEFPTAGPAVELVNNVGIFTPVWYQKPETQGFDVSPAYLDYFYTLNPGILKEAKVQYIMTNNKYRSIMPAQRLADLGNPQYFKALYTDFNQDVVISEILPGFFEKAPNYQSTFYELTAKLPDTGRVYIEPAGKINETFWRAIFLTMQMQNYEMYYDPKFLPIYNFVINFDLKFNGESSSSGYDYLVLSSKSDPSQFTAGKTSLFWEDYAGFVKIWKVE